MRTIVVALFMACALCSCAPRLPVNRPLPAIETYLRVGQSPYELDLAAGQRVMDGAELPKAMQKYGTRARTTSVYSLVDTRSGSVVGRAESALTSYNGRISGSRKMEISPDGGSILIEEEVSDASPSGRYILFLRRGEGTFATWYLAPPYRMLPKNEVYEFDYALPVIHLTDPAFATYPRFSVPFNR